MKRLTQTLIIALAATWLIGCVGTEDEAEIAAIQEAIEQDTGGFVASDEAPLFDMPELFAETDLETEDEIVSDEEVAYGPEGMEIDASVPGARAVTVLITWGQMPLNVEARRPVRWDGFVSTNQGGIIVRRTVRFEGRTDMLMPRPDRRTVPFRSATLPHHDGLLLTVVTALPDDDPSTEPGVLVIESEALARPILIGLDELAGFRRSIDVDEQGNRMVIVGLDPDAECPDGFLAGVWRSLHPGVGTFHGRWVGTLGDLHGHVRGIYGVNRAGEQVFFGKYIGNDGRFRGILAGHWGEGEIHGRWIGRGGVNRGVVGGRYAEAPERFRADGLFAGGWAEACDPTVDAE